MVHLVSCRVGIPSDTERNYLFLNIALMSGDVKYPESVFRRISSVMEGRIVTTMTSVTVRMKLSTSAKVRSRYL